MRHKYIEVLPKYKTEWCKHGPIFYYSHIHAVNQNSLIFIVKSLISKILTNEDELTLWSYEISFVAQSQEKIDTFLVLQKGLAKYINDLKCLGMSQHYLSLHNIQLVFHFCLYFPCDTKCGTL